MKILVLGGGESTEREVSLRSAAAVRKALAELGHEVATSDPKDGEDAVRRAGRGCDLVMPILHGTGGEDGEIQRLLDEMGVPYLGAGVAASELCINKPQLKELMRANGILTPAEELVTAGTLAGSELVKAPFVLKPVANGSSVGVMLARKLPYDKAKAAELLDKYGEMLVEELIEGTEITVAVLGEEALPVIEIVPPEGAEFDYENKYNGATAELCPAQNVSAEAQAKARGLAEQLQKIAGVRHLSRTDMIVTPEGEIYVLEMNTMPGLTDQSLFPKAAAVAGLSWTALVSRLVELARG